MRVGAKVMCVDDSINPAQAAFISYAYINWIKKDIIYTVREILENADIVPGLLLEEVSNPEIYIRLLGRDQEPAFRLDRFVELEDEYLAQELEESLSFEELLEV